MIPFPFKSLKKTIHFQNAWNGSVPGNTHPQVSSVQRAFNPSQLIGNSQTGGVSGIPAGIDSKTATVANPCYQRDGFSAAGWNAKPFYPQHYYGAGYDGSMLYPPQNAVGDQHNIHHVSQAYPTQQSQAPQYHENQSQPQRQNQLQDTTSGMYGVAELDTSFNEEKGK